MARIKSPHRKLNKTCAGCGKDFVKQLAAHLGHDFRYKFMYCSAKCRVKHYRDLEYIEKIRNGDYHRMNVSKIEALGFVVEVHDF